MLPEPHTVDEAAARGRLSFLPGETCKICSRQEGLKLPTGVSRIGRWRLNLQESAPSVVPKKWLITMKGRDGWLDKAG